jgi:hypothetical protein
MSGRDNKSDYLDAEAIAEAVQPHKVPACTKSESDKG